MSLAVGYYRKVSVWRKDFIIHNPRPIRENLLQEVSTKNQEFQATSKSLNSFLDNMPVDQLKPTDDQAQLNAKEASQKVTITNL